jgi:uncharacterized protein (TIGR02757 family)
MAKQPDFKSFFEDIYKRYNISDFIHTDPIHYPHTLGGNREFVAMTAACFAYGNVKAIKSFLLSFFEYYGTDPLKVPDEPNGLYYRFQSVDDVHYYAHFMKRVYAEYGSVENIFREKPTLEEGIDHFFDVMNAMCSDAGKGFFFLFPNPRTSGAKRLRMFLRWMIRRDDVDFGLWESFSRTELMMPIDTHILRFAKNNGIINTDSATRKNLESVSAFFRKLCPEDPAKYDFALTRLGIVNDCMYGACDECTNCFHKKTCIFI